MTTMIEIEKEIEILLEEIDGDYSHWTIGATYDTLHASLQHNDPASWHEWDVDSSAEAVNIKKYFEDKGMQPAIEKTGDDENYIYVFHNVEVE